MTDKTELERARPSLNYEDVRGLPANPTSDQEALASIAQSLKRLADRFAREEIARASAGGRETPEQTAATNHQRAPSPAQAPETGSGAFVGVGQYSAMEKRAKKAESTLADIRVHLRGVFAWTSAARHGIKNDPDPAFSLTNLEAFEARTRAILTDPSLTEKGGGSDREAQPAQGPDIAQPARDTDTPAPARCLDCGLSYDDPGFCDLVVPHDVWKAISPTGHEGGLLCPTCMCRAASRAGLENVEATFRSGPFTPAPAPDKALVEALEAVQSWAKARCPCKNEQPNPCPLCGADADKPGDICLSAENTIPRRLLEQIDAALAAARKGGE